MAGEADDEVPESGAVFTFGKSKFAENLPSKFWFKNDVPLKIACGDEHTALITGNGKLFMFGSNNWGQLGLGSKLTINKPTCVKALKSERVQMVACGRNHTLICTAQGGVYASGGNSEGQLGLGDCEERTSFQKVAFLETHGPIQVVDAGSNTSAALTVNGKLFMWGDNSEGQIGLGKKNQSSWPHEVSVGCPISWVSCGYYHSALVTVEGVLYTFGECDSGKLGLSTEQLSGHRVPQPVKSIQQPVRQVACGGGHTAALTEDKVYTFGLGQFGQLGHGTFIFQSRLPRVVEHFQKGRVCQVSCGENHTAVITDQGLLYTFGDGRHGKLALGEENFTNQFQPTLCPRFLHYEVQAASCGGCQMLVLARPRADRRAAVTLEDEDLTEDYLERPQVELLKNTTDSSTLQRILSARDRRRERERSPDHLSLLLRSLPVSTLTVPLRPSPPELSHRRVPNSSHHQEQTVAVESLSDTESTRGLGETTDFLNMTHVMKMDPWNKLLTLTPVHKRKGNSGKALRDRELSKQSRFSSASPSRKSEPDSCHRTPTIRSASFHTLQRQKKVKQDKENLLKRQVGTRRTVSKHFSRTNVNEKQEQGSKLSLESRKTVSQVISEQKATKVLAKPVLVKKQPIFVQSPDSVHKESNDDSPSLMQKCVAEGKLGNVDKDSSQTSKNDENSKTLSEANILPSIKMVAGAASLTAGALLAKEMVARGCESSTPLSELSKVKLGDSRGAESESQSADVTHKSVVSINIIPGSPEDHSGPTEMHTSQDQSSDELDSSTVKEDKGGGQKSSADVSEEEEECIDEGERAEEGNNGDSETLHPNTRSGTDLEKEAEESWNEEEEEDEETSRVTKSEDKTEESESKGDEEEKDSGERSSDEEGRKETEQNDNALVMISEENEEEEEEEEESVTEEDTSEEENVQESEEEEEEDLTETVSTTLDQRIKDEEEMNSSLPSSNEATDDFVPQAREVDGESVAKAELRAQAEEQAASVKLSLFQRISSSQPKHTTNNDGSTSEAVPQQRPAARRIHSGTCSVL